MACEELRAALAALQKQAADIHKEIADTPAPERAAAQKAAQPRLAALFTKTQAASTALAKCLAPFQPPAPPAPPVVTAPEHILGGTFVNERFNTSSPTWAKDVVGGSSFLSVTNSAPFEWTQVFNTTEEYDSGPVGLSGWAITPDLSDKDNPFLHPFGFDWEFFVAPDASFQWLAAPTDNDLYVKAAAIARGRGINVPNLLGVEIDRDLVPDLWRVLDGDRVCVWGRWIVDTGHPDYHTEIHPPLLLVGARAIQPVASPGTVARTEAHTFSTIIGRAFLVSQKFSDGHALEKHLLDEILKVQTFRSTRLEAHPQIMPKPFRGDQRMSYTLRPPEPRHSPADKLMVSVNFVVRTGVTVHVTQEGDGVTVLVSMKDSEYERGPLPDRIMKSMTLSDLKTLNPSAAEALEVGVFAALLAPGNPLSALIDSEGILTNTYQAPFPPGHVSTTFEVAALPAVTPSLLDDKQVFPVVGIVTLKWEREAVFAQPTRT